MRIRSETGTLCALTAGFEEVDSIAYWNLQFGNCRIDLLSDVVGAGTSLSAVTTDFDGDVRD